MYLDIYNTDTVYMSRKIQAKRTHSGCSYEYCSHCFSFILMSLCLPSRILVTRSPPIWCPKLGIRTGKSGRRVLKRLQQSYQRPSSSQPTLESFLCPWKGDSVIPTRSWLVRESRFSADSECNTSVSSGLKVVCAPQTVFHLHSLV